MELKKLYAEVIRLQDEFNSIVDKNWKKNRSIHDWAIAVFDECAEILNSLPWKWWKKMDIDLDNIKIEIVDTFHFVLSQLLHFNYIDLSDKDVEIIKSIENLNKLKDRSKLSEKFKNKETIRSFASSLNSLVTSMFAVKSKEDSKVILYSFLNIALEFMSFVELCKLYIGKNALNKLRQDYGYKTGTYRKVWKDGKEDNVYLQEILQKIDANELSFQLVYKHLQEFYEKEVLKRL